MDTNSYSSHHHHLLSPFAPFDAAVSTTLSPPTHPAISTFSSSSTHSLLLAHGGILSSYDPSSLSLLSNTRTHLDLISSLLPISNTLSVVGSLLFSSPGLHLYNSATRRHVSSLLWSDPTDTRTEKSRVTAVNSDDSESTHLFASFECRHGENAVLVVDKETFKVVSEVGRQNGNSANSAALTKLRWVPQLGFLVGSSVNRGAFGYSGYLRVWDPRSGEEVWESKGSGVGVRMGDIMADVDVDVEGAWMAKVGSRSGDVAVADMRRLGGGELDDPWVYLQEPNPGLRGAGAVGVSAMVYCWNRDLFVARDGALEAWTAVKCGGEEGDEERWGRYRRNYVDKEVDVKRGIIRKIEGGGNRLFVARENAEGVEVWESSRLSGVMAVVE